MDEQTLIQIEGLYQIFGPDAEQVLPKVKAGASKDDVLAETGHTVGLRDINLTIDRGEIFVIMGLSGSGKSTLIRHFNRLIDPTAGKIKVNGDDIMQLSMKDLTDFRRHKMSMVFQHFGLFPHRTVVENVGYGLSVKGQKKSEWEGQAKEWLETVGLAGYEEQYPSQLSGGQQQRVGLARALCTDAEILLMDEAFSALDPLIRYDMQSQLIELQETLHKTIIFITHDLDEALRLGDRIAVLKDGKLVQVGKPVDIILNPADDYVRAFAKDVNRARALFVKNVMSPALPVYASDSLDELEGLIDEHGVAYRITDEGMFEACTEVSPNSGAVWLPVHSLSRNQLLQDILPTMLESSQPLPVIDKNKELCGYLSHKALAKMLQLPNQLNVA
ncbi:quaternary amine ABC transporter ATP-binding protein [Marinomonas ostreistagni]|uniref:Quaternary amine transport ATP-binding protein n=1 Tax=Marinomonas ostreistagni TaxID=359209 RepID=A0ABS0ZCL9_9GAMM|nr:glycine betaine/L-proline ABC transporter ATP-binding protein [Marinomonas ostreistagni]MBJ7551401.1 glycine betaine/L-proline ABC transporter ATP-binding protein [Marinomonas ostreistagni]